MTSKRYLAFESFLALLVETIHYYAILALLGAGDVFDTLACHSTFSSWRNWVLKNERKQKLIDLGTEALADTLLNLAVHSQEADALIEQLIATPKTKVLRYQKALSGLKQSKRFYDWRAASGFARELIILLQNLKSSVDDPFTGVELVAAFYDADETILAMSDDSSGNVGDVFRYNAKELFVEYASRCPEKDKVADIILKLNQKDGYSVRDSLIHCAAEFLSEAVIRTMVTTLQNWAEEETKEHPRCHFRLLIESLARQIKDAKLFEKTRFSLGDKQPPSTAIDIAQVYLECGDVESALSWLKQIPDGNSYRAYERIKLYEEIYRKQGDSEKLTALLLQNFRSSPSKDALQELLEVIGFDKRDDVINDEVLQILNADRFQESDAEFLLEVGKIDETEAYILKRADQLDGNHYGSLLSLAEAMAPQGRHLVTSLMYRSLLTSILERGYTKAYPHGIRYLKKLDKLALRINDWKGFDNHDVFKAHLNQVYGRKRSFWSEYQIEK